MPLSTTAKNTMLDALPATMTLRLHNADPGAAGASNLITGATASVTYAAAAGGERDLDDTYDVAVSAGETATHWSVFNGATFIASGAYGTPETWANEGTASVTSAKISLP